MTLFRKSLAFLPIAAAFLISDKTLVSFGVMLVSGMFMWIPYWLAWWLSDGFITLRLNGGTEEEIRFHERVHNKHFDDSRNQQIEYDSYNQRSGYRFGPQGFGLYIGSMRIDH